MKPYIRKVQYYETDMMGIVHHANYIHWMEEARIDFLNQLGFPYAEMEKRGAMSPVRAVSCSYKKPCSFDDEIAIEVNVQAFNGVVLTIGYTMRRGDELICTATSEHVFLNKSGGFVRLRRDMPDFCAALEAQIPKESA